VNRLSQLGLLEETIEVNLTKKHARRYASRIEHVGVSLTGEEFEVELTYSD
jgi:hypothetical protein